jgi:hypothetical protein
MPRPFLSEAPLRTMSHSVLVEARLHRPASAVPVLQCTPPRPQSGRCRRTFSTLCTAMSKCSSCRHRPARAPRHHAGPADRRRRSRVDLGLQARLRRVHAAVRRPQGAQPTPLPRTPPLRTHGHRGARRVRPGGRSLVRSSRDPRGRVAPRAAFIRAAPGQWARLPRAHLRVPSSILERTGVPSLIT